MAEGKATSTVETVMSLAMIHDLFKKLVSQFGVKFEVSDDPKQLRNQLNELCVGHFRILFREKQARFSEILDLVFTRLVEADQLQFSLIIFTAVDESAKAASDSLQRHYVETAVIVTQKKDDDGKDGKRSQKTPMPKVELTSKPKIFEDKNYLEIIADVAAYISACEQKDNNAWADAVIRRLDEINWIGGGVIVQVARSIKDPKWVKKFSDKLNRAIRPIRKTVSREYQDALDGIGEFTKFLNGL